MIVKELNERYKFEESQENSLGMLSRGKRLADDQWVDVLAIKPDLKVSREALLKTVEENRQIAERLIPQLLLVTEVGTLSSGQCYVVTEGADLPVLADVIKTRKNIDAADVMAVGYQLAYTLRQLNTMELLHLNINDQNIYLSLEKDKLKVRLQRTGFRHFIPEYSSTENRPVFWGTPEFMAPEICSGKGPSSASDQYSLGILLYEMITGKPPFTSKSPKTTIKRQVYEKPLPIHLVRPSFKNVKDVEKVLTKLLHKDPAQRYEDLTEVMDVLAQIASVVGGSVEIEQGRDDTPPIDVSRLVQEQATSVELQPKKEEDKAPVRETMMFTGMVDEIEDAIKAKPEQADTASRDDIERATTQELKPESSKEESKPEPKAPHKETIALVREDANIASPEKKEPAKSTSQTGDEWFVSDSSELAPRDVFDEQKESRLFWIIIAVVIVIVGVAVAFFVGSGKKETMGMAKPEPIKHEKIIQAQHKATHAVPVKPVPAPKAVVPVKHDAGTGKAQPVRNAAGNAKTKDAGIARSDAAKTPAGIAPTVPAHLPIEVKKSKKKKGHKRVVAKHTRPPVKKIRKKKSRTRKFIKKAHRKKARKSRLIPKGMTPKQASRYYFKAGRAAEKTGNYKKALSNYRKVLAIDPGNRLVPLLIKRIQTKQSK